MYTAVVTRTVLILVVLSIGCQTGRGDDSCEMSVYGCCPDGITEATGWEDDKGCPQGESEALYIDRNTQLRSSNGSYTCISCNTIIFRSSLYPTCLSGAENSNMLCVLLYRLNAELNSYSWLFYQLKPHLVKKE